MPDNTVQIDADELARLRDIEARMISAHERLRRTMDGYRKTAITLHSKFVRDLIDEWDAKKKDGPQ